MKKLLTTAIAVGLGITTITGGAPVAAENPHEVVLTDWIGLFPDTEAGVSVFLNITARDFCDWVTGPPGPPPAIDPVIAQGQLTGQGAFVGMFNTDVHIEIWAFDEDPSPLIGPCEDIAEQLADPEAEPLATGTANWHGVDNDLGDSGTRANAFGDSVRAMVTDQDGNDWRYSHRFHINTRCNAPEMAPPSCLILHSSLTQVQS